MEYTKEVLEKQTIPQLLKIAKEINLVGRHDMRKPELVDAILDVKGTIESFNKKLTIEDCKLDVEPLKKMGVANLGSFEEQIAYHATKVWEDEDNSLRVARPKNDYIKDAKKSTLIAFKVDDTKVISGKIEEIHASSSELVVQTKNGIKFIVRFKNVVWVRTGPRWPRFVYLALKGEVSDGYKGFN